MHSRWPRLVLLFEAFAADGVGWQTARTCASLTWLLAFLLSPPLFAKDRDRFVPDQSLLRHYDELFHQRHPYQPFPALIEFATKGKRLTVVATKHQKDCSGAQRLIDAAFKELRPEVVLIEGLLKSWVSSPRNWDEKIKNGIDPEGCDVYFAYKRAIDEKVPYLGTEPGRLRDFSSFDRDKNMVIGLASSLNQYTRVLVVYGAGHFVQQELVLQKMLGKPMRVQK